MIVYPHDTGHPGDNNFFDGQQPDARVGGAILVCLVIIVISVTLFAAAGTHFGVGPSLEPVAYLLIALVAAALLITYLITFIGNEIHAAVYMLGVWGIILTSMCLLFYAFG